MSLDPAQRERLRDDLQAVVRGELLFDDLSRALYSTDASIFQVEPLGVVTPLDEEDVQAVVRYCAAQKIALIPRGAGTGLAGESLGEALVLDLSRHFRKILEVGPDWVRVQPGVVWQTLNAELAKVGRRFAPDPASGASCTVGGMLATNASGSRCLKFGYTRDHVLACRVVVDSGDTVSLGREPLPLAGEYPQRVRDILQQTAALLSRHADAIRQYRPKTPFNRCGYLLADGLEADGLHVPKLLAGSEGTLALFTEATLKTVPLPGGRAVALLCFASRDAALQAVALALPAGPTACELLDRRLVALARTSSTDAAELLPPATEAALLLEFEADHPAEARRIVQTILARVHVQEKPALSSFAATTPDEIARCWNLRDGALPALFSLGHGPKPIAYVEDVGVPPEALGEFLTSTQDLLQRHETTASFLVHAGTGQVHIRPFLDLGNPADAAKLLPLADAIYGLTLGLGGTVSAQHGTGLARTPWVERQYGPLYPAFHELKAIFDPQNIFNPGKIVGGAVMWPLRKTGHEMRDTRHENNGTPAESPDDLSRVSSPESRVQLHLAWQPDEVSQQLAACNGCGHCRVEAAPQRMCPTFRVSHAEAATPRAKVNLLRYLLTDPQRLGGDDVKAVADLCVNCKMCARECPAFVKIPKLMLEAKAAHHAEHGLERADWMLSRLEMFAALGSRLAPVVNPLLGSRAVRWMIDRLFGVSRHRRLPPFASPSFLRRAAKQRLTEKPATIDRQQATDRVAYFVDVFANYNDPQIAEATVAVLRHNGVDVYVPPGQWGCGMGSLAAGDVETARELAQENIRVLAELAREGYRIVCSEPSAAVMLQQDYVDLFDDFDARTVAGQTVELTTYLLELHERGRLRTDFQPVNLAVGHHVPCHIKALGDPAGPQLLALIPELRVHTIDVSCSGMAGTFGLKRRNYWPSLEAGRPMLEEIRRPRVLVGSAECSACRLQMEDGSGKRALHPVQYLAMAYGLLPEVARRLRTPLTEGMTP
ncbi:MAG: FAD-linked oxidase C-terminal domain-containing protein [Gemmataceae bacterium]